MQINNFIVCDLIRREDSNKHIFVGVYDDAIIIQKPDLKDSINSVTLPLSFFIRFRSTVDHSETPDTFKFVAKFNSDLKLPPIEFEGIIKKGHARKGLTITLSVFPFSIPCNANRIDFGIQLVYADGKKEEFDLGGLEVTFATPANLSDSK